MQRVDLPARVLVERLLDMFVREIFGTRRKDVIRLIITEGPRFPKLAEFYYREVIARVLAIVRPMLDARGRARRIAERCAGALSAAPRRAGAGRRSCGAGCSTASSRSTCRR